MYKKDLDQFTIEELKAIIDDFQILETYLYLIQKFELDMRKKGKRFDKKTTDEIKKIYTFWKVSYNNAKFVKAKKEKRFYHNTKKPKVRTKTKVDMRLKSTTKKK